VLRTRRSTSLSARVAHKPVLHVHRDDACGAHGAGRRGSVGAASLAPFALVEGAVDSEQGLRGSMANCARRSSSRGALLLPSIREGDDVVDLDQARRAALRTSGSSSRCTDRAKVPVSTAPPFVPDLITTMPQVTTRDVVAHRPVPARSPAGESTLLERSGLQQDVSSSRPSPESKAWSVSDTRWTVICGVVRSGRPTPPATA